jgi:glycosyltransferase involved in cell wall biosynthesis
MKDPSYVLVSPVRNEERTISITIECVLAQSVLPREWVIVSDESTDRTDELVSAYAARHPWLRLVRAQDRPARNFASVVFVTELGIKSLHTSDYDFLGLLDTDIRLPRDYYANVMLRFASRPSLGLAGGLVLDVGEDGKPARASQNLREVAGAVQFFRRSCFESLGSLMPLPEGGWDALTCVRARMNGFETVTFPDIIVDHLKPRNSAHGNPVSRKWQMGVRDYALGYHPLFELIKCVSRISESPMMISSLAWLAGYAWASAGRRKRLISAEMLRFIRQEQVSRLKNLFARSRHPSANTVA